jgi:hypothetical protein
VEGLGHRPLHGRIDFSLVREREKATWIGYSADAMLTALNIVLLVLNAAFIGVGIYLSSYLKKKAEHLATKEDFEQLRAQTAALTQTTKEIEARISNDVWDRQKRWELKREVLFSAMRKVATVFEALKSLENLLQTELKNPLVITTQWKQMWIAKNDKWFKASAALNESYLFVCVTCGTEIQDAIVKYKRSNYLGCGQGP